MRIYLVHFKIDRRWLAFFSVIIPHVLLTFLLVILNSKTFFIQKIFRTHKTKQHLFFYLVSGMGSVAGSSVALLLSEPILLSLVPSAILSTPSCYFPCPWEQLSLFHCSFGFLLFFSRCVSSDSIRMFLFSFFSLALLPACSSSAAILFRLHSDCSAASFSVPSAFCKPVPPPVQFQLQFFPYSFPLSNYTNF